MAYFDPPRRLCRVKVLFGQWTCEVEGPPEFCGREIDRFYTTVKAILDNNALAAALAAGLAVRAQQEREVPQ